MELPTVVVSISMLMSMTLMLLACASCRKIVKKRKKSGKKNDEENGIVVPIDSKKLENGISNPAYDTAANNDDIKKFTEDKNDDDESHSQENENSVTNTQDNESLNIENECATMRTSSDASLTEDKQHYDEESAFAEETPQESEDPRKHTCDGLGSSVSSIKSNEVLNNIDVVNSTTTCAGKERQQINVENGPASNSLSVNSEETENTDRLDWSKFDSVVLQGGWRRDVKLTDLLEMKLITEEVAEEVLESWKEPKQEDDEQPVHKALIPFLYGETPVAGIWLSETGETKSIFRSAKDGILRRGTAISLLEAQAATGNIIDPVTGRKMSVTEGFQLGFLDKVYETVVSRAERAVSGYKSRVTDEVMSLGQAMERGLVIESHGTRLLEVQLATGGIIDHKANVKVPINVAIKRGLLNETIGEKLANACEDISDDQKDPDLKSFFDPNTEENVTYRELMRRSIVDDDTGMRLYPLEKIARRRFSYASYSGRSSLASSRATSRESIPAALAAEK